jgi:large subunit ribosomal protein L17
MRHMKRGRKLNRTNTHRKAMFRNMVTSLMRHERIVTTLAKAKELRGVADRVITYAKKGSLHHRRLAARLINDREVLNRVFDNYSERYAEREGGYTRIMKLGWRHGDAAPMAIIELMPEGATIGKKKRRRTKKADAPAVAAAVTTKESFETDAPLEAEAGTEEMEAGAEGVEAEAELDAEAATIEAVEAAAEVIEEVVTEAIEAVTEPVEVEVEPEAAEAAPEAEEAAPEPEAAAEVIEEAAPEAEAEAETEAEAAPDAEGEPDAEAEPKAEATPEAETKADLKDKD